MAKKAPRYVEWPVLEPAVSVTACDGVAIVVTVSGFVYRVWNTGQIDLLAYPAVPKE